jgi:hypothetical protein
MVECVPSTFLVSYILVALYLCSGFFMFNRLVLEKYVS